MIKIEAKEFLKFIDRENESQEKANRNLVVKSSTINKGNPIAYDGYSTKPLIFSVVDRELEEKYIYGFILDKNGNVDVYENELIKFDKGNIAPTDDKISIMDDTYNAKSEASVNLKGIFSKHGEMINAHIESQLSTVKQKDISKAKITKVDVSSIDNALNAKPTGLNFKTIKLPEATNSYELALAKNAGVKAILAFGGAGTGKTYGAKNFVKSVEEANNTPVAFYKETLTKEMDKTDLLGYPDIEASKNGTKSGFNYGALSKAMLSAREGHLTVLLLDEIFRMKDRSVLFNLHGEDTYSINTGRKIEIVQLLLDDNRTAWFQLSDTRKREAGLSFKNGLEYETDNKTVYMDLPEQKLEDLSAIGALPKIFDNDFDKYELEDRIVSSFKTLETITVPKEKLFIIAAGNIGTDYESQFSLTSDLAFMSRFSLHSMEDNGLEFKIDIFKSVLKNEYEKGYSKWNIKDSELDRKINNLASKLRLFFEQAETLVDQGILPKMLSSCANARKFDEIAQKMSRYEKPDEVALKEVLDDIKISILQGEENESSLVFDKDNLKKYKALLKECVSEKPTGSIFLKQVNKKTVKKEKANLENVNIEGIDVSTSTTTAKTLDVNSDNTAYTEPTPEEGVHNAI